MSPTIDHLRVDHRITVRRDFTDAAGVTMRRHETGILRAVEFQQLRVEIHLEIERATDRVHLVFPLAARTGPRNGHMREYFEVGEDVSTPRILPTNRQPVDRTMKVPPPQPPAAPLDLAALEAVARSTEGPDRLEAMENALRKAIPHIGVAASIAECYAERMRAFQRAGDEPRARAAFALAMPWLGTYAGWATSGGEGEALSYERDQFRAELVREFGYDPTEPPA